MNISFMKRPGKKIWSGWLHAWDAFDGLVYWYVIGEKQKSITAEGDAVGLEEAIDEMPISANVFATPIPLLAGTQGLNFTPVTQHLYSLAQAFPTGGEISHTITMNLHTVATVPKDLQYPESNEDAYAWDEDGQRAAVFDGATESFAAQRWVASTRTHWLSGHPQWIQQAREEYNRDIKELNLSWAQLDAAERGSYTTMVSIESTPMGLRATTIGDSCIFLLEGTEIIACDPYVSHGEFFASPQALSTRTQDNLTAPSADAEIIGDQFLISPADVAGRQLLLATDALSQWLMITNPQGRLARLLIALEEDDLVALVTKERASGELKTDDTTALLLTVSAGDRS